MQTTVTARTSEMPVTLDEAKSHLRVIDGNTDEYIETLIAAATELCESRTGRSLRVSQTLTQTYRCWPCCVHFDRQPVLALQPGVDPAADATVVQYYDADGVLQTVDSDEYRLLVSSEAGATLEFDSGFTRPALETREGAVIVTYMAGYATIADVPARAKHAIKLLVGHWFTHQEAVNIGNVTSEVPMAVDALLGALDWGCYR